MTQQVDYNSNNIITADPKLIRRLRWGVFLGLIAGAIPLLYCLAVCVYVLSSMLGIVHSTPYLPEPPIIVGMTLLFLAPAAWLLTKATMSCSLPVFLEMLFARIGLALLIVGLWDEYRALGNLFDELLRALGLMPRSIMLIAILITWNVVIWTVLHLAARNLRLVGLKKHAQAIMVWLTLAMGWLVLVTVFYVATESFYSSFYASALGSYVEHMAFGLLVILVCLFLMIEILAVITSIALRRIQKVR